jgi:hypothetical protein
MYAPIELLYGYRESNLSLRNHQIDAYHLGSLMTFMFTGIGTTAGIIVHLDPNLRPGSWNDTYEEAKQFLSEAFDSHLDDVAASLPDVLSRVLLPTIRELTNPVVEQRGMQKFNINSAARLAMERYVAILNRLRIEAEMELRKVLS